MSSFTFSEHLKRTAERVAHCPPGLHYCSHCDAYKSPTEFHINRGQPKGLHRWCKLCTNTTNRIRNHSKPDRKKDMDLRTMRGISLQQYEELFALQGGTCAICKQPSTSARFKYLSVDHCHLTGKVRGLLCGNCNHGLGHFRDNPQYLASAIEYLARLQEG